jgi:ribose 5-phosphate isomerase B
MKIYLGADHNGLHLKNAIERYLAKAGYDVVDTSGDDLRPEDDYPVIAQRLVKDLLVDGSQPRAVLICGSGQGMCMAANRFKGVRALLGYDTHSVKSARNDDDANVLCLPSDLAEADAAKLVDTFIDTPFEGATRFRRRIREMDEV